jgi:hypothetical protein
MTHMKNLAAITGVALVALALVTAAGAGSTTASTSWTGQVPTTGQTLNVTFTISSFAPVVPYEYAVQNTCAYPKAHFTLGQRDDITAWTDTDPVSGNPQVTMPVYLQSVPAGATCKVSLVSKNTVVKGSTQTYTVGA